MAAYVILDIEVTDPVRYEDYKRASTEIIAKYGGQFIVRGGKHESIEGEWDLHRVVVIKFESVARARECWNSKDYAEAKAIRQSAARTKAFLIEGV